MEKEIKRLVSVIIPTYKRYDTIDKAINSVLNQTYEHIEIIVVDDNGVGTYEGIETEKTISKYLSLDNFKYIQHEKNINGSAARNTGFYKSKGQYIMFLDDDDEFINNKIESQVYTLDNLDSTWGACYSNYIRKKDGKIITKGAEKREGDLLVEELMRNLFVHAGSNLMVRRDIVIELDGFNDKFKRNQDLEFLARVLMKYKLAYTDEVGLIVNMYDKEGLFNFEDITSQYINEFEPIIKRLSKKDQYKIYTMINLQLTRYYIINQRRLLKGCQFIMNKKIPFNLVALYFLYLVKRYFSKSDYGFKFEIKVE